MNDNLAGSFSSGLEVCFEIKLFLASRIEPLEDGAVFEFISAHPNAKAEVEPWVYERGYDLLEVQDLDNNQTRFLIRR